MSGIWGGEISSSEYPAGCVYVEQSPGVVQLVFNTLGGADCSAADDDRGCVCATTAAITYTEEVCGGTDIHRFVSLEHCCDDLGTPARQDELTTYLESLDEAVMGPVCVAASFTK